MKTDDRTRRLWVWRENCGLVQVFGHEPKKSRSRVKKPLRGRDPFESVCVSQTFREAIMSAMARHRRGRKSKPRV